MRKALLGLLAILAFGGATAAAAGIAVAHKQSFPSTVETPMPPFRFGDLVIFPGTLSSPKARCRAERPVALIIGLTDGSRRQDDRGTTSANGSFAFATDLVGASSVTLLAPRHRLGPRTRKHRHVCARASFVTVAG